MEIKLTFSVLFFIYFGGMKCTNEFKFKFPVGADLICDDGFQLFNGNCYKLMENNANFDDSKLDCENIEASLSSIHDAETNQFLLYMAKPGSALLGLQFDNDADIPNYTWTDGSPYDFKNFPSDYDEPVIRPLLGDCVMMQQNGQWVNKGCLEANIPHFCQKIAHQSPTSVPPTFSPPNTCPSISWYTQPGVIYSPGYPYHYNGSVFPLNCSYTFVASGPISINFIELSNCEFNDSSIYIYEGINEEGPLLKVLTGDLYVLPINVNSTKNSMFMRFVSYGRGRWRAEWNPLP